jgi:hypothetical protein
MPFKYFFAIIMICVSAYTAQAQFKIGVKAGIGSYDLGTDSIKIQNGSLGNQVKIAVEDASYGYHFGLVAQINLGGFIIQPEVLYNSNSVDFKVTDGFSMDRIVKEKYQYLDIPILFGTKAGPLRLNVGPVGHVFLQNTSGFTDIEGYKEDFKSLTLGFQAGLGIDFWKILLDIRYEGNLTNFGSHITFDGNQYQFSERPRRLLASISFVF